MICKMQKNVEKCKKIQRNAETCRGMKRNIEKCRESQRNSEKCRYPHELLDLHDLYDPQGNVVFDILEPLHLENIACWVLQKFEKLYRL